ncbi:MAG: hypothetical protein LBD75_06540 [Candidatus Peribacteria bacterium]|nr:hypothetical protein [Candidatus Peribacteria bacterium]
MLLKEISRKELHKLMHTSLIIEVDDVGKAVELLEHTLNTKKYFINEQKEIVLEDYIKEPFILSKLFIEYGLKLSTIKKQETTLEQYFISLIENNV